MPLWLSVSEIEAIIDSFDALEAVRGVTSLGYRIPRRPGRPVAVPLRSR